VSDRIHAPMHCLEPSPFDPMPDCAPADAGSDKLLPRNNTMLALGQVSDPPIHPFGMQLSPYEGLKCITNACYSARLVRTSP
jgi:hypothetical protein